MSQLAKIDTSKGSRLITVTGGNLRNSHVYITGLANFFPGDAYAGAGKAGAGKPVTIELVGLNKAISTDIPCDARTGKPRHLLRSRGWVREFFTYHRVAPGDTLLLERTGARSYRLAIAGRDTSRRTFLEFFAGIGLVRLGLEKAGWSVAYANDLDESKRQMYDAHFGDAAQHFDLEDVHNLSGRVLPDAMLATASFPCTDLSLAGGRKGLRGAHSSAFFGFIRALSEMGARRPPLVMLENVVAFLSSHGGADFEIAMSALDELGYFVDPFVLDAKWFVPQSRPRLFVVATRIPHVRPDGCLNFTSPSRLRPKAVTDFINAHPDIHWSIRNLPEPPSRSSKTLTDIIEDLPDDSSEWWSRERGDYLYNQMSDRHRAIADRWIAGKTWTYGTVFRRVREQPDGLKKSMGELRYDGIAGCLRTPKGGSGRQILFKAGFGVYAARLLTPRECARLMGAGDFRILAPLNQALFGFGDAVCVPAISWIAENYLNHVARQWAAGDSSLLREGA